MKTMLAVVFTGHQSLEIRTLPVPRVGERDVLMRVAACGVCGSDARSWFDGDSFTHSTRIPGHEPAGVIVEKGAAVENWSVGDRIALAADLHCGDCYYCRNGQPNLCDRHEVLGRHVDGALCEYMLLPDRILTRGIVNRVPDSLSLLHAALSEPICSILASHDELAIAPEETVLIIGCGPMGVLHLELARNRGARVLIADITPDRLELVRTRFAVEHAIDASNGIRESVYDRTDGRGADVVICAAPSADPIRQAPWLARKRGRIGVFAGVPHRSEETALNVNRIHYGEQRVIGNFSYHPRYHRMALDLLASGAINCEALIKSYSLGETESALYDIRHGRVLKAVVTPSTGELQ